MTVVRTGCHDDREQPKPPGASLDRDDPDIEIERLACQGMIQIQHDGILTHLVNPNL